MPGRREESLRRYGDKDRDEVMTIDIFEKYPRMKAAYNLYPDLVLDELKPEEMICFLEQSVALKSQYTQPSFVHKIFLQAAETIRQTAVRADSLQTIHVYPQDEINHAHGDIAEVAYWEFKKRTDHTQTDAPQSERDAFKAVYRKLLNTTPSKTVVSEDKYKCSECRDTGKVTWTDQAWGQGLDREITEECKCRALLKHHAKESS